MPRKPAVSIDRILEAIYKHRENILTVEGRAKPPSDNIWHSIFKYINNDKISKKYLYQFVHDNRHGCLDHVKSRNGFCTADNLPENMIPATLSDSEESKTNSDIDKPIMPSMTFRVIFTPNEWTKIKPIVKHYNRNDRPGHRARSVLPPEGWTNLFLKKIWEGHRIPCGYTFKRAEVSQQVFLKITAVCHECGATAEGTLLTEPMDGEPVTVEWRANDSRTIRHYKNTWLRGIERETVADKLQHYSAVAFRQDQAVKYMQQGDLKPPHLYSTDVLRKAKEQRKIKSLDITEKNPVKSLQVLKHGVWAGSIHDIGVDKFFVHYHSPSQMVVYKTHCQKKHVKLCIDATGTLVKKVRHELQSSGHIFLYEAVMVCVETSVPVAQMLSERHDGNAILYWLNEWRRSGAPIPAEVIIDNSPALKSAVIRAFCECSVESYLQICYEYCLGNSSIVPRSYIRLDVAHFINAACRWPFWSTRKNLKPFYLRCLGLLIKEENFETAQKTLKDILMVAISPFQLTKNGQPLTMEPSLQRLIVKIEGFSEILIPDQEEEERSLPDVGEIASDNPKTWARKILTSIVVESEVDCGRPNPYYLPEVAEKFVKLAVEMPLWSGLMKKACNSPHLTASSSNIENKFGKLKNSLLKGETRPMRVDKFVCMHLKSVEGACRLSSITEPKKNLNEEPTNELSHIETWKGLGANASHTRKKKSLYLDCKPEATAAIKHKKLKEPRNILLRNGNFMSAVTQEDSIVLLKNTCAFDSFVQVVVNAYIYYETFRDVVDENNDEFAIFLKNLASKGAIKEVYSQRGIIVSKTANLIDRLKTPAARMKKMFLVYDCWTNAGQLIVKLMNMYPYLKSLITQCKIHGQLSLGVLDTNSNILLEQGMQGLPNSVILTTTECRSCNNHDITKTMGALIVLEVEHFTTLFNDQNCENEITLSDIPDSIMLGEDKYSLCGVIAYQPGHFIAYCKSILTGWTKFDDLTTKETPVPSFNNIMPSILVYCKLNK